MRQLSAIQESDVLVSPAHQKVLELFGEKELSEEKGGKEWSEEEKEEEEDTKPSVICQDVSRKPKSPSGMPYDPWVFMWNDRIFVLWYCMCHLDVKEEFSVSFDSVENKVEITLKLPPPGFFLEGVHHFPSRVFALNGWVISFIYSLQDGIELQLGDGVEKIDYHPYLFGFSAPMLKNKKRTTL